MSLTLHSKNPRTLRAYCAGFRSFQYRACTEDSTKVNCTRCAKAMGITPAAKPESKFRTGTCQCCFNSQKVSKGNGKLLSLHGYERPGHGYIVGDCMGQGEQPFEVSCELTKKLRTTVENMKTQAEAYLARLQANEVEELHTQVETDEKVPGRSWTFQKKTVTVHRGDAEKPNPYKANPQYWEVVPSFEKLHVLETAQTESKIRHMTSHIRVLTEKIDGWVKVWES